MFRRLLLLTGALILPNLEIKADASPNLWDVPIFAYHHIGAGDGKWSVHPLIFEDEMNYLAEHGYQSITMASYAQALLGLVSLPEKPVVLSFDDGYEDMYSEAIPLMAKHGFTGTFYVITGFVGTYGYLTWEQIKKMSALGMDIGSHTVQHVMLTQLPLKMAEAELETSKSKLEQRLGAKTNSFAYPYNDHNRVVESLVQAAGYTSGAVVDYHHGDAKDSPFVIPRITVLHNQFINIFARGAMLGYRKLNRVPSQGG